METSRAFLFIFLARCPQVYRFITALESMALAANNIQEALRQYQFRRGVANTARENAGGDKESLKSELAQFHADYYV